MTQIPVNINICLYVFLEEGTVFLEEKYQKDARQIYQEAFPIYDIDLVINLCTSEEDDFFEYHIDGDISEEEKVHLINYFYEDTLLVLHAEPIYYSCTSTK